MKLHDSLSDRLEPIGASGEPLTFYVCGITPYDTTHVGHAFTYCAVDSLIRYLESEGRTIRYVQNVTDIDDDILRKAAEVGEDWRALGDRWTRHYIEDMRALNVRPPDAFPRATEVIAQIVETVDGLLAAGVAYQAGGSVYFHINDWPEFGKLSKLPRDRMLPIANERGNHPDDPNKRDPLDFVLWQAQVEGEPAWPSPWGPGRPGWHIECSTMATRWLGTTIDLHGGGDDLCFPHHECEIAQVEPLTGRPPFVRCWFHTAMVAYQGEKMSKSLGNLVMVRDLLETFSPDAIRFYLASHHYRQAWSYDPEELVDAERQVELLKAALLGEPESGEGDLGVETAGRAFDQAMQSDLDTPRAIEIMGRLAKAVLGSNSRQVGEAQAGLRRMGAVFGLRLDQAGPERQVADGWQAHLNKFAG